MIQVNHTSVWYPDYICDSILDVPVGILQRDGITHLVFDLDKTLVPHGANTISTEFLAFLHTAASAGFTILIGSNTKRDIRFLSELINLTSVQPIGFSYKPFASFYKRITAQAGVAPAHIAMIGDHIVNDIIGANQAGITTILVTGPHHRIAFLRRWYVRRALRKHSKQH
jgi:HAD superfamily phosphatase (TIGR01668 family)